MMNSEHNPPSQAAIGRALGLSPASMTKYKRMGMPVDSVEAAHAWRMQNIKMTAHSMGAKFHAPRKAAPIATADPVARASELMSRAAADVEAGHSIDDMIPQLRLALRAVPNDKRDDVLVDFGVMHILTAEVHHAIQREQALDAANSPTAEQSMTDDEANDMGDFWYRVAAGEVRLSVGTPS